MKPRKRAYQNKIFEILLKEINPLSRVEAVLSSYMMDSKSDLDSRFYENIYLRSLYRRVPVWSKEFSFGYDKSTKKGVRGVHELSMNTIMIKYPFLRPRPWSLHNSLKNRVESMFSFLRELYQDGMKHIEESRKRREKVDKLDFLISCGCDFDILKQDEEYALKLIEVEDQQYIVTQNFRAFEKPQFRSAHYQQWGDTMFTNTLLHNIIPADYTDYEIVLGACYWLDESGERTIVVKIGADTKYPVKIELGKVKEGKMASITQLGSPWHNFGIYGGRNLEF